MGQDLRYALRALGRHRGLSAVIVVTLALAIGANTAIFSLMDALLYRALPVRSPQTLYLAQWSWRSGLAYHGQSSYGDCEMQERRGGASHGCIFSVPFYHQLQQARGLAALAASAGTLGYTLSGHGDAVKALAQAVSGNYFSTLGLTPARGRLLMPADDQPGAPIAMVLSYAFWVSEFGANPAVIGRTVALNNVPVTLVGVAPAAFPGLTPGQACDGWIPLAALPRLSTSWWNVRRLQADNAWLVLLARVKPGVSLAAAQAEADSAFRSAMFAGPAPMLKPADDPHLTLAPAQDALTGLRSFFRVPLLLLLATAAAILLIACANIAGLLLGRARARGREIAVRRALGAGRWRILRQLVIESLLLAFLGGAAGLALAFAGARALTTLVNSGFGEFGGGGLSYALDGRVLLFALTATLVTGLLFGLAPGLGAGRLDLARSLKDGVGNSQGRRGWFTLGNGLVVAQVALGVVVLAGAGLMLRTLANLRAVNPGFDDTHLLLFSLQPVSVGYKGAALQNLYVELRQKLAAIPGVRSVGFSSDAMLTGSLWSTSVEIPSQPTISEADTDVMAVSPGFFANLKMRILKGRDFGPGDLTVTPDRPAPGVAAPPPAPMNVVVNEAFVRKYLAQVEPLGQSLTEKPERYTIVGIVNDAKYQNLRAPVEPTMYIPEVQGSGTFELRTAGDPLAVLPAVRRVVREADARLPVTDVTTQQRSIERLLFRERMLAELSSFFAGLALLLAAIGLYALLAQEVTRRTREIGIRMALGAERGQVMGLVLGAGAGLAAAGLALGSVAAWGATRYLQSFLYGVQPFDPATLAAVAGVLFAVALAACYVPGRRATRIDPLAALRCE